MNLAFYNHPDWKAIMASSPAMLPAGFFRAAKIGTVALVIGFLATSSEQLKQEPLKPIVPEPKSTVTPPNYIETGKASWYGHEFQGQETASGEVFDPKKMTAAHPSLPMGTKVEVTNLENNKKAEVKINDRGPFVEGRVIDISPVAAKKLGMVKKGTAKVKIVSKSVKKKISKKKAFKKKIIRKKHMHYRSGTKK